MEKLKRKIRIVFWLVKGFLQKHFAVFIIAIIVGFISFSLIKTALHQINQSDVVKSEIVGVVGNYTISNLPRFIQDKISFGLTTLSESKEASPGAAVSFEATDSGKTYIFNLRKDLVWQDNQKFVSRDINYNLKDIEINYPTDEQIQFKLKDSFSPLPIILSQPLFRKGLIGLGNEKVVNIKYGGKFIQSLTLENYDSSQSAKTSRRITIYRFYPSNEAAIAAYKLGEVTKAINLTSLASFNQTDKKDKRTIIEETVDYDKYVAVFYNTKDKLLSEKSNRQALSYALPRTFPESASRSASISPKSWAYNTNLKASSENLDQAKKLLEKVNPEATKSAEATQSSSIKISLTVLKGYEEIAQKIQTEWARIDIQTEIEIVDFPPNIFQTFLTGVEIPSDPDQYTLWHSTQSTNITGLASPRIDKLLEDGRKITDKNTRLQKYLDFQRILLEEVPASFLYYPKTYSLTRI